MMMIFLLMEYVVRANHCGLIIGVTMVFGASTDSYGLLLFAVWLLSSLRRDCDDDLAWNLLLFIVIELLKFIAMNLQMVPFGKFWGNAVFWIDLLFSESFWS